VAAGFVGFEITWRKDVFGGAPQAGSAASFGTLGINFRARKPVDEQKTDTTLGRTMPSRSAEEGRPANGVDVDTKTLRGMLERGDPVTVVDVRKGEDRAEWSIPGSVHFDTYDALNAGDERAMEGLDLPEGAPVVIVCGRGRSSATAAEQLRRKGYEAFSLEGGMKAWSLAWNTAKVSAAGTEAEVVQVRRTGKGCLSYLVGSGQEAAVIDAAVDPEVFMGLAEQRGWRIAHVLDTHVHADHLSRSRMLADLMGAKLHMPEGAPVSYPFSPLGDGDEVRIGTARLGALRTPGHTAESMSYLLDGKALFTGDTLFLSAVGRPDLEASSEGARDKARALHGSLRRVLALDGGTLVLPGHTSEPVPFDAKPICAPLSEVRGGTPLLGEDEEPFVERMAGHVSPTPDNYERIVELNRSGQRTEGGPTELEAGANRCAAG
jgi:glyoxylase-like metal-dependent hydrolase (beta-lactamase superfamily II)